MNDSVKLLTDLWPVVVGVVSILLYLGALHQMVKVNNRAIGRLFDNLKALNDSKIIMETSNAYRDKDIEANRLIMESHAIQDVRMHADIVLRIDHLAEIFRSRKTD